MIAEGLRLFLRRLNSSDNLQHYLDWLNDSEIQKFTRRRGRKTSGEDLADFLKRAESGTDYHLAICLKDSKKHIGNISLNSIDPLNQSAEVSIMLGDFNDWPWRGPVRRSLAGALPSRTHHRTWPSFRPMLILDRIYCRPEGVVIASWVDPAGRDGPDHLPVFADITI